MLHKLIGRAHKQITRTKGKEYAPTSNDIQRVIDIICELRDKRIPDARFLWETKFNDGITEAIRICQKNIQDERTADTNEEDKTT